MRTTHVKNLKIGFALTLLLAATVVRAQSFENPQKEFTISFSNELVELSPGETEQLDVVILKSKSYLKSKVKMGISSTLPEGVTITFDPDSGNFDATKAIILVDAYAPPGQHLVILNATLNNKTKGTILKLLIK